MVDIHRASGHWAVDESPGEDPRRITLVLVRHAESQWNAAGVVQGHDGPGLTDRGRMQADQTAAALLARFPSATVIVRSDLVRVAETAQPFERATGLPVRVDPRWREIDNGAWAGKPRAQVEAEFPEEIIAIRRGEDVVRGGGESFGHLRNRVAKAIHDVAALGVENGTQPADTTVIVFTHGGTIRAAAAELLGLPPAGHRLLEPPLNCSITVINQIVDAAGELVSSTLAAYNRIFDVETPKPPTSLRAAHAAAGGSR